MYASSKSESHHPEASKLEPNSIEALKTHQENKILEWVYSGDPSVTNFENSFVETTAPKVKFQMSMVRIKDASL